MKQRQCLPSSVKYNIFTKLKQAKKKKKKCKEIIYSSEKYLGIYQRKWQNRTTNFLWKGSFFFSKKLFIKIVAYI